MFFEDVSTEFAKHGGKAFVARRQYRAIFTLLDFHFILTMRVQVLNGTEMAGAYADEADLVEPTAGVNIYGHAYRNCLTCAQRVVDAERWRGEGGRCHVEVRLLGFRQDVRVYAHAAD